MALSAVYNERAKRTFEVTPWVTPRMAATAFGRSERTIREWVRRGDVGALCLLHNRMLVVWWPDVMDMNDRSQRRQRRREAA